MRSDEIGRGAEPPAGLGNSPPAEGRPAPGPSTPERDGAPPPERARAALRAMLGDNPNPNRASAAPAAYLGLIAEGAEPDEVLSAWKRRRAQAGRRPARFQPQLAAWLAAPGDDPRGARAMIAAGHRRALARENAARSAAAGELYAESEEFRAALDLSRDQAADPARRAAARAKARAMIDEKAGENAERRRPSDDAREKR